jgi:methylenetetrahydrofolate dehydrogenase (NADP+)/methenyltetrahydrofolate cyclohydrolase
MTIKFNGKSAAAEVKKKLIRKVKVLKGKGITPHMSSILIGENPESQKYLEKKKAFADDIGAQLEIIKLDRNVSKGEVIEKINNLAKDDTVCGVMVQLPLPATFSRKDREEIVESIEKKKDIDGMREQSMYVAPVVKSVLKALGEAYKHTIYSRDAQIVVVGAEGFVGKKILKVLNEMGYEVKGVDIAEKDISTVTNKADVLISSTGTANLINAEMVKEGSVVIDVGSPEGDVSEDVFGKVKFASLVPGGVGPLTIAYLLENLVDAASS